ncbi:MAG: ATP-binding protein, partial [Myxococcales bacterium]|nr:ATP-binding protein [Myxococcales bacterium]
LMRRYLEPETCDPREVARIRRVLDRRARLAESASIELPMSSLVQALRLDEVERQIVVLLAAIELDWELARTCRFAVEHVSNGRPTVGFLAEVLGRSFAERCRVIEALGVGTTLRDQLLVDVADEGHALDSVQVRQVGINRRVVRYLMGRSGIDEKLSGCARLLSIDADIGALEIDGELWQRANATFEVAIGTSQWVRIVGPAGGGKKTLTRRVLAGQGQQLLVLDLVPFVDQPERVSSILRLARLEALLSNATLYLDFARLASVDAIPTATRYAVDRVLAGYQGVVVVGSRIPIALGREAIELTLPQLELDARERLWERAIARRQRVFAGGDSGIDVERLARQFPLSAGGVIQAAESAFQSAAIERRCVAQRDFENGARVNLTSALDSLATRIDTRLGWDDAVLPSEVTEKLAQVRIFARNRRRMQREWGFDRRAAGRGLSVLLYGPPGTGKTMIAGLLANELGLELFRVDLSQTVSKWIGETEKNLGRIFDAAQQSGAILLFDEADSLFAKRTDVKSSNDRYANLEVNYLLQRMEQYDGISVLTTNRAGGLDEAFQRRLRYRIHVPLPQKAVREELWRRLLPANAPLESDVDWLTLAERFELSGGQIQNAVERAAVFALDRDDRIRFDDLYRAGVEECQESGKAVRVN